MDKAKINKIIEATAKTLTSLSLLENGIISFDRFGTEYICNYQKAYGNEFQLMLTIDWLKDLHEQHKGQDLINELRYQIVDPDNYFHDKFDSDSTANEAHQLWSKIISPFTHTKQSIDLRKKIPKKTAIDRILEIQAIKGIQIITDETEEYIQSMPQHYVDSIYNADNHIEVIKLTLEWLDLRD